MRNNEAHTAFSSQILKKNSYKKDIMMYIHIFFSSYIALLRRVWILPLRIISISIN